MKLIKVPWLFGQGAITISPYVLILNKYANNKGKLAHEQVHLDQIHVLGWWKFYTHYIFNLSFRKRMEDYGYAVEKSINGHIH